jgi:hypothetical protein
MLTYRRAGLGIGDRPLREPALRIVSTWRPWNMVRPRLWPTRIEVGLSQRAKITRDLPICPIAFFRVSFGSLFSPPGASMSEP